MLKSKNLFISTKSGKKKTSFLKVSFFSKLEMIHFNYEKKGNSLKSIH